MTNYEMALRVSLINSGNRSSFRLDGGGLEPLCREIVPQMFRLLLRTARTPWIDGKHLSPIHLRPLHDRAEKVLLPSSSNPDLAVSYLVNSCGLSQVAALSAASKLNLKTTENADSIIGLLRANGLTTSHIASIITKYPRLLCSDAESTIKPKLEFFLGVGVSNDALVKIITATPEILLRSLEKRLRPNFEMLKTICGSDKELLGNTSRFLWLLQRNFEKEIFPNLKTLREHGVPPHLIARFAVLSPQALLRNPVQFSKSVVSLKEMGFDPSKSYFISGLKAVWMISKSTWERRFQLYQSLGWSAEETIAAFKKYPSCMTHSDEKIRRAIGVFSDSLICPPSYVANHPVLLTYSVEKTVVPRCNVMNLLVSKGLATKNLHMTTIVCMSQKNFFEKYVLKHKDQAPEILEAYMDKLDSKVSRSFSSH